MVSLEGLGARCEDPWVLTLPACRHPPHGGPSRLSKTTFLISKTKLIRLINFQGSTEVFGYVSLLASLI